MKTLSIDFKKSTVALGFYCTLCLLLFSQGCSSFNGTRLEGLLGGDVNLIKLGDKIAESLITQSFPPVLPMQAEQPVIVTTLVDNNDLTDASNFGRSLQNHIAAGFVSRGFTVKEMKLRRDVLIQAGRGEFMLTRHLRELAEKQRAQAVVVGTYSMANRVMYLSARLVSPGDRTIRSAYEDRLYLDENSLNMLGLQFSQNETGFVQPPSEPLLDKLLYW